MTATRPPEQMDFEVWAALDAARLNHAQDAAQSPSPSPNALARTACTPMSKRQAGGGLRPDARRMDRAALVTCARPRLRIFV
jgi:hypothetical protein